MNDYDPSDEYALMADAGMTFREILAALTTTPAAIFGEPATTGRIAPGQPADLVVLDGDPSRNVRALADVRYALRDGAVVYFRDQFRDDTSERARRSRVGARLPR